MASMNATSNVTLFSSLTIPQAEQFLTQGFAEVKMRLLADIVEVVIRTHTSLSKLHGGGNSVSSQKPKPSVSADTEVSVGTGSGWGVGSDVLRTGPWPLYPWANPTPISLPSSRTGSVDSRDSGGDQLSDSSARPRSPPRLSGGPMSIGSSRSCGSIGEDRRQPTTLGSSNLNDEQNAPSLTAPAPSHTCVAPYHWLADRPPASYYSANAGAAAAVDDVPANGGGATLWLQDPECFKRLRESVMHGPRSAQYSLRESSTEVEVEAATTMRHDAAAAVYNHGRDRPDWHAVQQALGSLDEFQVPSSPPAVVPSSPSTETGVPRLAPPPMSSTLTPRTDASSKIPAESSAFRGDGAGSGTINPLGRGFSRTSGTSYEPEESLGGIGCGDTGQDHDKCWGELSKLKQQIKAMLDQHMRLFESKIKDTEQVLSARLTLLETKVQGLEVGSPVHS